MPFENIDKPMECPAGGRTHAGSLDSLSLFSEKACIAQVCHWDKLVYKQPNRRVIFANGYSAYTKKEKTWGNVGDMHCNLAKSMHE